MEPQQNANGKVTAASLSGHAELLSGGNFGAAANHYRVKLGSRLVLVTELKQLAPDVGQPSLPAVEPASVSDDLHRPLTQQALQEEVYRIDAAITRNWRRYVAICVLIVASWVGMTAAFIQYSANGTATADWIKIALFAAPVIQLLLYLGLAKVNSKLTRIRGQAEKLNALSGSIPVAAA